MLCVLPLGLYILTLQPHPNGEAAFEKVGVRAMSIWQMTLIVIQMNPLWASGGSLCAKGVHRFLRPVFSEPRTSS